MFRRSIFALLLPILLIAAVRSTEMTGANDEVTNTTTTMIPNSKPTTMVPNPKPEHDGETLKCYCTEDGALSRRIHDFTVIKCDNGICRVNKSEGDDATGTKGMCYVEKTITDRPMTRRRMCVGLPKGPMVSRFTAQHAVAIWTNDSSVRVGRMCMRDLCNKNFVTADARQVRGQSRRAHDRCLPHALKRRKAVFRVRRDFTSDQLTCSVCEESDPRKCDKTKYRCYSTYEDRHSFACEYAQRRRRCGTHLQPLKPFENYAAFYLVDEGGDYYTYACRYADQCNLDFPDMDDSKPPTIERMICYWACPRFENPIGMPVESWPLSVGVGSVAAVLIVVVWCATRKHAMIVGLRMEI